VPLEFARAALWAAVLTSFAPYLAAAQQLPGLGADEPLYVVPRVSAPIVLDGRGGDPAWRSIDPLPGVMYLPSFGAEPSERTEFRMAHDGEFLYFSCRNFDSNPEGIQAVSLRRDANTRSDDNCGIYLDTFNDEQNALAFITTPTGRRIDQAIENDAEGGPNFDWNSFWDVAVSRDGNGWYGEMRIPFSSLLLQTRDGRVVMGVSMRRMIARSNETITHPAMPPSLGPSSFRQPSLMRKIMLEGVERVNPIYVTPYSIVGTGYSHEPFAPGAGGERDSNRVGEVGFDLRYGLTSNLTLDVTVNTDFAQVEADDQQVNLSRFSLFFPEKRRFFQERGAIFEYSLGGQERLFHSRRVGLAGGEPVRIFGGGRMVGRVGEWDVGVLNIQTAESELLPSENQGVIRLRRRVLNPNSYAGGIVTSRIGRAGHRNVVYGLDGVLRMADRDYLTVNWSQSFEGGEPFGPGAAIGAFDRGLVRVNWERRGQDGLSYALDLTRAGEVFEPGMGFLRRRDYAKANLSVGHGWRPGSGSRFLTYAVELDGEAFRRNRDDVLETVEIEPELSAETRGRHQIFLSLPGRRENLRTGFALPEGASVPAGEYRFAAARFQYLAPQGDLFRPALTVEGGQFFDGRRTSVSFGPGWNPSMHFSLDGSYGLDHVDFAGLRPGFTAHVARLRSEVMFSTTTSTMGFIQYNSAERSVVANFRFHYSPREGNDLYIVWNEGLATDRRAFEPAPPLSTQRTLLVKYSHTLQLRL